MILIIQICLFLLMSCSTNMKTSSIDYLDKIQGLYKLKSLDCIIREDRKSFCTQWKYLEIVETKNKFHVNTKYTIVLWDQKLETYVADRLLSKDVSLSGSNIFINQSSSEGIVKIDFNKDGVGEYLSDYRSPHEGRIMIKYKFNQIDRATMKIPYPGP